MTSKIYHIKKYYFQIIKYLYLIQRGIKVYSHLLNAIFFSFILTLKIFKQIINSN